MPTLPRILFDDGLILRIGAMRRMGIFNGLQVQRKTILVRLATGLGPLTVEAVRGKNGLGQLVLNLSELRLVPHGNTDAVRDATVAISATPSPWGRGEYLWFVCPETGRRCRTLYMPPGQSKLACYRYWPRSQFAHACENRSRFERSVEQSRRLRAKLGKPSDWLESIPPKPPRMSQERYEDLVQRIDGAELATLQRCLVLANKVDRALGDLTSHSES